MEIKLIVDSLQNKFYQFRNKGQIAGTWTIWYPAYYKDENWKRINHPIYNPDSKGNTIYYDEKTEKTIHVPIVVELNVENPKESIDKLLSLAVLL